MNLKRSDRPGQEMAVLLRHILVDIVLYTASTYVGLLIRFDFRLPAAADYTLTAPGIIEIMIFVLCNFFWRLPRSLWRYTDIADEWKVIYVVVIAKIAAFPVYLLSSRQTIWSRGAYLTSMILAIVLMVGVRGVRRVNYEWSHNRTACRRHPGGERWHIKRVLIAGAGNAGEKMLREYEGHRELGRVIGLLDDDPAKVGCLLRGRHVLGKIEEAPDIIRRYNVDELIVAIPSHQASVTRRLMPLTGDLPVVVKTLPAMWQIADGSVLVEQIHNVQLTDLLQRTMVRTDLSPVAAAIRGKVVLVTGAGGSIGSEIVRQVAQFEPRTLVMLGRGENRIFRIDRELSEKEGFHRGIPVIGDMRDQDRMRWLFDTWRPDIVFHAAAHKHVPLMEQNPEEAILNNVGGTRILLQEAMEHGVGQFINISTDKAVDAVNFMGASKRVVELLVQEYDRRSGTMRCTSVRFGNVLGSNGSVIEAFQQQLRETRTLRVTDPNMERYFMLIPEAVQLVLQAGSLAKGNDIFVLSMGEPINIAELARTYIKLSGLEVGTDASIIITGNRGNEKLTEELCSTCEQIEPTRNKGIMRIVCPTCAEPERLFERLDALCAAAGAHDVAEMRCLLHAIDPTINISPSVNTNIAGLEEQHMMARRIEHE